MSETLFQKITDIAHEQGVPRNHLIERALREYLDQRKAEGLLNRPDEKRTDGQVEDNATDDLNGAE
jgi:metal-responsive CopG/Arc/MetJ family transcriptional regulator